METATASTPMPQYVCHKKVWALKIKSVDWVTGSGVMLEFDEPRFAKRFFADGDLKGRPTPEVGYYMIQYADGYISFSPAKQFEEGYTPVR
jgi:hypothetical protein